MLFEMEICKQNFIHFPYTMRSNVDPHDVRLPACVHSRTAAGSWPKAAVTLSLYPLLPLPAGGSAAAPDRSQPNT